MSFLTTTTTNMRAARRPSWLNSLKRQLPPVNYITLHYLYFVMTCLLASIVFWLCPSSEGAGRIDYTDCLFLVVSAMTEAGLNTVNLSEMSTVCCYFLSLSVFLYFLLSLLPHPLYALQVVIFVFKNHTLEKIQESKTNLSKLQAQQSILFVLIIIGSSIFVSIATVLSRKWVIEARFKHLLKSHSSHRRRSRQSTASRRPDDFNGERAELELAKTAKAHGDMSGFESRHSEPRDPISTPELPERGRVPGLEEGGEEGEAAPLDLDQDRISHLRYAPSTPPGVGRPRILSFTGVGAHPLSTSYRKADGGDGISLRGRAQEMSVGKGEGELDGAE